MVYITLPKHSKDNKVCLCVFTGTEGQEVGQVTALIGKAAGEYLCKLLIYPFLIYLSYTVKPVLNNHIKQDIFLAFQTGGCLLLHGSSAESSCESFHA